jgi:hypothetical protein
MIHIQKRSNQTKQESLQHKKQRKMPFASSTPNHGKGFQNFPDAEAQAIFELYLRGEKDLETVIEMLGKLRLNENEKMNSKEKQK